jgi:uncharacterized protein YbjT (DUF2867 family)
MRILVIGGIGTVGSHVVRELLARKAVVKVLTRVRPAAPPNFKDSPRKLL